MAAKDQWARLVPKERSELLHTIADRLAQNTELLSRLESANTGKPLAVSRDDVGMTIDTFRFMAGPMRATTSMAAGDYAENRLSVILREPLGVIGVITPWNYPLLMAAWKIAPILAAGNTLVIKPSEQTPLTTLKFAELVADLLPPGVLNVVNGYGAVAGARLAEHPDVNMIALTGSVNSGRAVARTAADTLKRVHLELGGKAPVVIFSDADLAAPASSLRVAGFWNSGQECGAACRVLVHESVAERFVEQLVGEVRALVAGEPNSGENVEVGPMVSKAHFGRVTGYRDSFAVLRPSGRSRSESDDGDAERRGFWSGGAGWCVFLHPWRGAPRRLVAAEPGDAHTGRFCCSMYCLTTESGAPPTVPAK
ncbi:aldehyde dehydrogenase family protein [Streptomyces sp. R35]|uniref:Aldehyde dehydrogenase family protein n=1 Tax=Streptomyces sp. R35 TaxID=3238630 RepID=A0AB39SKW5_9ACTN